MKYTISENMLFLENDAKIKFDLPIREVVEVNDIIVVVLQVPTYQIMPNNAFGVRQDKIIWQVETDPHAQPNPLNVYIGVDAGIGKAYLINFGGMVDIVDINTGKIIGSFETK